MTIRDATEGDLPAIVAIYNSIIPGRMVTADLEPVTVASRLPWFQAHNAAQRPLWVAEDKGVVCAWLSFDTFFPRAAYDGTVMIGLYVGELHRGAGLGRMMLTRAIDHAPKIGIHTLLGYIFGHNAPSLKLFASFGFESWGHLPGVARLPAAGHPELTERDLIIVGKRLTSGRPSTTPSRAGGA